MLAGVEYLGFVGLFYIILIMSIPFNGLVPILPAGEMSGDGFFYASLPFNAAVVTHLFFRRGIVRVAILKPYLAPLSFITCLFIVSTILSAPDLLENSKWGRSGLSKFILSFGAYIYYAITFGLLAIWARDVGIERFIKFTCKLFFALGVFMVAISLFEIASWFSPALRAIFTGFRSLFASEPARVIFRLSGVSYEPSFFALSILVASPWVLLNAKVNDSKFSYVVFALLIGACIVSGSRTAWVGLFAWFGFSALTVFKSRRDAPLVGLIPVAAMVSGVLMPLVLYERIPTFENVSNITRTFIAAESVQVGLDHPLGVGFGQVPFYNFIDINSYVDLSWELSAWYRGDRSTEIAPIFSWYGRTIGELGLIGYSVLAVGAAFLFFTMRQRALQNAKNELAYRLYKMSASYGVIFFGIGLSSESYKFQIFWMFFFAYGLFMAVVKETRQGRLDPSSVVAPAKRRRRKKLLLGMPGAKVHAGARALRPLNVTSFKS